MESVNETIINYSTNSNSLKNSDRQNNEENDLSSQFKHTTVIHSTEESVDDTFKRLKEGCSNGVLSQKEIIDGLFNLVNRLNDSFMSNCEATA